MTVSDHTLFLNNFIKSVFSAYINRHTSTDSGPCQMDSDLIFYMQNRHSFCLGYVGKLFGGKAENLQIAREMQFWNIAFPWVNIQKTRMNHWQTSLQKNQKKQSLVRFDANQWKQSGYVRVWRAGSETALTKLFNCRGQLRKPHRCAAVLNNDMSKLY